MYNFSHNNHFRYYIDDELFGTRTNKHQKYKVTLGKIDKEYYINNNFYSECLRVADLQHKDLGNDKILFLSGGLDSEIMLRSFINIGVKPRCVTVNFKPNYTDHQLKEATELANSLGVKLEVIDFDVVEFYKSGEAIEMAKKYGCIIMSFLIFYKVIAQLSTPSILGCELHLTKQFEFNNTYWALRALEHLEMGHIRFANDVNIPVVQEWFAYTPELMLYFLDTPEIKALVDNKFHHQSSSPIKNELLERLYPKVTKNKIPFNGYENLRGLRVASVLELSDAMPQVMSTTQTQVEYSRVIAMLKGETTCSDN